MDTVSQQVPNNSWHLDFTQVLTANSTVNFQMYDDFKYARHIRIESNSSNSFSIREFQVYGNGEYLFQSIIVLNQLF